MIVLLLKTNAEIFENFNTGEMKNVSNVGQSVISRVINLHVVMGHILYNINNNKQCGLFVLTVFTVARFYC